MNASLDDARLVLDAGSKLLADAVGAAKALTENGKKIDDYQVLTERVAYAATEAVAAVGRTVHSDREPEIGDQ